MKGSLLHAAFRPIRKTDVFFSNGGRPNPSVLNHGKTALSDIRKRVVKQTMEKALRYSFNNGYELRGLRDDSKNRVAKTTTDEILHNN